MSPQKLIDVRAAKILCSDYRSQGRVIGLSNGCFDIIHPDHIAFLRKARKKCDILLIGLNSDSSVKMLKGADRPFFDEDSRVNILSAIEFVDYVIVFDELSAASLVRELKPDIYFKGLDYLNRADEIIETQEIKKYGGKIIFLGNMPKYSTSTIINKLKRDQENCMAEREPNYEYLLEKWKYWGDVVSESKKEEKGWLTFALLAFGAILGTVITSGLIPALTYQGLDKARPFLFFGLLIMCHMLAFLWLNKSLIIRWQYYDFRSAQISAASGLGEQTPQQWKDIVLTKSQEKMSLKKRQIEIKENMKKFRDNVTSPKKGKLFEIYTIVTTLALITSAFWLMISPFLSASISKLSNGIWIIFLIFAISLCMWPRLIYYYLDLRTLKKHSWDGIYKRMKTIVENERNPI